MGNELFATYKIYHQFISITIHNNYYLFFKNRSQSQFNRMPDLSAKDDWFATTSNEELPGQVH